MATQPESDSRFRLSGPLAEELAATYDTPLYVLDEGHLRARIAEYRDAFRRAYPDCEIAFAGKANSTLAVLAIAASEGCAIDVASEGELRAALAAGVPGARCHLHGNNKRRSEIAFALSQGIGMVVADHLGELETLAELGMTSSPAKLVLRLAPGVDPVTHARISTGQADTKFGFNISDGAAEAATRRALELGLPLVGFHCHVGSQLVDPEAQRAGGELIAGFARKALEDLGFRATYLNVGGGLGVRYTDADHPMPVATYNRLVVEAVLGALEGTGLQPTLAQEPGRALVAESGATLYRVGVIKTVPARIREFRTYVSVDGGLSDNPRPAMYDSRYTVLPVRTSESEPKTMTVSGKHCETDLLFQDVDLPSDLQVGDLLQVLCTGAYNASMASNYNRYPRPASVLIRTNGTHELIQRRENWDEMLAREILPEGLSR